MSERKTRISRIESTLPRKKRMRVAAYARVSTEKGAMLHSLAAQISYYSELIQSNPEYEYAGVYADEGLSGTLEGRPEFQRMLQDCREGKIDRILCKSISRFARNTVMLLKTVRELKLLGVSVYFEEQNINTMSGEGELMLTVLASFAQEESRSVSENCKWRIRKKFEQGIPTGLCMYGYKVKNGVFTIIPEEAEIIRRIFRMYLEGIGCERIMKALIEAGVPAPNGGMWSASTILLMLRNEKYAGDLLLQKYYINNHIEKKQLPNRGELPQYAVTEDHEPIIDRATFDAVQKEIRWRAAMFAPAMNGDDEGAECDSRKPDEQAAPAMTIPMICGICGKRYRRKITRRGTAYAAPVWICSTYNYRGKAYCASKQIPEPILLELIATALDTRHTEDEVDHLEVHPNNRILFVFRDGHTEEHIWKDHSRKDSWDTDKRKKAAEKTRTQHQRRREREAR
ncbi:MAG: recombinase family protein [Clostridia bacterium]|nr:recombinase family protein [Clostridia bacterium]